MIRAAPFAAQPSIRRHERIRNFDAHLAIVPNRTGMERHECILVDILRDGFRCRRMSLQEASVIGVDRLHKLIDQIVGEIGTANCKIVHAEGGIVLVQGR